MKYDEMSVQSLRAECKKLGIAAVPRKKSELIELLTRSQKTSLDEASSADGRAEALDGDGAGSDAPRDHRVSDSMTEEEKVRARRKRFGAAADQPFRSEDAAAAPAESMPEDERIKIEQRKRRFDTKG